MPDPVPSSSPSWFSASVVSAFGRNVVSYAGGAITMAMGFAWISKDQADSLMTSLTAIANGLTSIAGGTATVASIGGALYAAWSATHGSRAKSLTAAGDLVITKDSLAKATPDNPSILSKDDVKVVAKDALIVPSSPRR